MFNSISNNFGAGVIQFKDVQESNYIVLNAKFTCSPQSAEYQAAEVLEIYVPGLNINRSTEAGVIARYKERGVSYGYPYIYDGGTVLKSWVKDERTICIEKLPVFDNQTELIIYIQTLYCMLGQGGNSTKGKEKRITATSEENALRFSSSYCFCVVFEKWIFYHMMFDGVSWAFRNLDWEAFFDTLPEDVTADVPIISAYNYGNDKLGCITESRLEGGYWMLPKDERGDGFENTANYVFSFGYLIRDREEEPEVEGRLHYENEQLKAGNYEYFNNINMELIPSPALVACEGNVGIYKAGPITFAAPDFPEEILAFEAFFLDAHQHSNGLTVQLLKMTVSSNASAGSVMITDCSGDKNLSFKLFDTAIAMATE